MESKTRSSPASHVGFRLPDRLYDELRKRATDQGTSPGDFARRLVMSAMQDEERRRTTQEIQNVRQDVKGLRADVAKTLKMILLNTTKASEETVDQWIGNNLLK